MAADRAQANGESGKNPTFIVTRVDYHAAGFADFPPEVVSSFDDGRPAIGSPACVTDSSATWAGRDAVISALDSFCAGKLA